jgi:hypothetical protein
MLLLLCLSTEVALLVLGLPMPYFEKADQFDAEGGGPALALLANVPYSLAMKTLDQLQNFFTPVSFDFEMKGGGSGLKP